MKRFLKDNGLTLVFALLFLAALVGQAVAGQHDYNAQQLASGMQPLSLWRYLTTSDFAADTAENWQSEYLQFTLYIWLTVFLVQRGSAESKSLDDVGKGSDEEQLVGEHARPDSPPWVRAGGWRLAVYSRSLVLVMGALFLLSWAAQAVAGWSAYDEQRLRDLQAPVSWARYLTMPDFWSRTLQNWQSEFLAVASMAVLSVYLRHRGSPESKKVGSPHDATGDTP